MALQLRRGTAQERLLSGVVLAVGELLWTYDDGFLYIGDGITPGGTLVNNKIGSFEVEGTFLNLYEVESYQRTGSYATYNTRYEHGLVGGEEVEIAGLDDPSFNGIFTVEANGTGVTTIRVYNPGPDTSLQTDRGTWKLANGSSFVEPSTIVWDATKDKFVVRLLDKTDVGLDQVDNTSDIDKPVSTAQQAAIDAGVAAQTLGNHADVTISGVSNGQALVYDSATGDWINGDVASGGGGVSVDPLDRLYAPSNVVYTTSGYPFASRDVWSFKYSQSFSPIRAYEWTPQRLESIVFENYRGWIELNQGDEQVCEVDPALTDGDWILNNNPYTGTGINNIHFRGEPNSRVNTDIPWLEWVQLNDNDSFAAYASWETNDNEVRYGNCSWRFKRDPSVTCDYTTFNTPTSYSLFGTGRAGPQEGDGTSFFTYDEVHLRPTQNYNENRLPKMVGKATFGGSYANIAQAEADGWTVVQYSNFGASSAHYYPTTNPNGDLRVSVPFPIELYGYTIDSFVFSSTGGILFLPAGQDPYLYATGTNEEFKNIDERWAGATNQLYFAFEECGGRGSADQCMWQVTGNAADGNRTLVIRWRQKDASRYYLTRPVELSIAEQSSGFNFWAALMGPWYTGFDTTGTTSSGEWLTNGERYLRQEYNTASVIYDATLKGPAEGTQNGSFDTSPFAEKEWGKGFAVLYGQSAPGGYDGYYEFNFNKIEQIDVDDVTDGQVLTYNNAAGKWQPVTPVTTVETLGDVVLTNLANGEVLQYDGANWVNAPAGGGGGGALGDLTDVTITAAAAGEVLRYNGSAWVDAQLDYADLANTPANVSAFANDSGYLTDIVLDVTPQLGGNLDVNGNYIVSTANGNVSIAPNGTGLLEVRGNTNDGSIKLNCSANTHGVTIKSPPHAAAATYTLTLPTSAGTNGQVLTTDGTGTLSWSAGGGGGASVLDDLTDVTITAAASGEVLRYNGSAWVGAQLAYTDLSGTPTNVSTFTNDAGYLTGITAEPLGDLSDVVLTSPANGNVLSYNGTNWVNSAAPPADISGNSIGDLSDVTITAAATGEVLRYNGTAWVDAQLAYSDLSGTPTVPANIGDLGDVTITAAASGEVLRYNGSAWVDAQLDYSDLTGTPALVSAIDDLSDVTITAAAAGEVLRYNGTAWVDAQLAYTDLSGTPTNVSSFTNDAGYLTDITGEPIGDLSNVSLASLTTGDVLSYNGSNWVNSAAPPADISGSSINALNDVDTATSAPSNGEGLIWNSTSGNWEPGTVSAGPVALNDLTDVTITAAASGEVLRYNGSAWVDAQLAYSDLSGTPSLAPVATSGDYNDLTNKPTVPASIDDLTDVDTTTAAPTSGQVLKWNGANWVPQNESGGGTFSIDDATDVDTSTTPPTLGQVLKWDGANWVPDTDISGGGGSASLGRGDGGDVDALTVDSAFVFGVYGGGDIDTTSQDDPIEFVTYDVDGGEIT